MEKLKIQRKELVQDAEVTDIKKRINNKNRMHHKAKVHTFNKNKQPVLSMYKNCRTSVKTNSLTLKLKTSN